MLRLSLPELGPLMRLWKQTLPAHSASLTHAAPNGFASAAPESADEAAVGAGVLDCEDEPFPREHAARAIAA